MKTPEQKLLPMKTENLNYNVSNRGFLDRFGTKKSDRPFLVYVLPASDVQPA